MHADGCLGYSLEWRPAGVAELVTARVVRIALGTGAGNWKTAASAEVSNGAVLILAIETDANSCFHLQSYKEAIMYFQFHFRVSSVTSGGDTQ